MRCPRILIAVLCLPLIYGCSNVHKYDLVIRNGLIYDGSGSAPFTGDVAIEGDIIAAIGNLPDARGRVEIDATGKAVSPGFINMLSWANESLIEDGRSQSDIRQGVTLEVLGEGRSMGPLNEATRKDMIARQGDIKYDVPWTTLGQYLDYLVDRGVSCNVASFVGNATVRANVIGYEDRKATATELKQMQALVRQAMQEGAMGLSSALIYTPSSFADTDELIALAKIVAEYNGMYISHIRNEGDAIHTALDEFITIARKAGVRSEIYHLKSSGRSNWSKLDSVFAKIEAARAAGLPITADMYTYHASSTGLSATMPPWVREGGHDAWIVRLKDPVSRERIKLAMNTPTTEWDNCYLCAGSPDNILLIGFKNPKLKPLIGKTLAEVAAMRNKTPEETAMDLMIEDDSRIGSVYFSMSEDNIRKKIQQPWVSFCSDGGSYATEGVFLKNNPHPRAYGSFARLLGKYVRDERLIPLQEAIRRLTSLPAKNLGIEKRGHLEEGYYADVVVFDPNTIEDNATFTNPHQYATGVKYVLVNGVLVLNDGNHTEKTPGRVIHGPGWKASPNRND